MRTLSVDLVKEKVVGLCVRANLYLRPDVLKALRQAYKAETKKQARGFLKAIIDNALIARQEKLAICQDTGMPMVFLDVGRNLHISGNLKSAVNKGVELGYKKACLRNSIVKDPLQRGVSGYAPAVMHIDIVQGSKLKITVLPKGFGCENKSRLKMFKPTAGIEEIKKFIIDTVRDAGPDACPPYVVGVGIGGTADYAGLLAKKALLKKVTKPPSHQVTSRIEKELLKEINRLNIGPMGLGGKTTALGVNILTYPTHIAGMPVAVNISCHALRSATMEL